MNLPTLILHYESIKNRICKPSPRVTGVVTVVVKSKISSYMPVQTMPVLLNVDTLNDVTCENGREKYRFCEQLELAIYALMEKMGAMAEQHYEPEVFFDIDFQAKLKAA